MLFTPAPQTVSKSLNSCHRIFFFYTSSEPAPCLRIPIRPTSPHCLICLPKIGSNMGLKIRFKHKFRKPRLPTRFLFRCLPVFLTYKFWFVCWMK